MILIEMTAEHNAFFASVFFLNKFSSFEVSD